MLTSTVYGAIAGIPLLVFYASLLFIVMLSWGLVNCFLKSIRATFCHQYVVEKIAKHSNGIDILEQQWRQEEERKQREARAKDAMFEAKVLEKQRQRIQEMQDESDKKMEARKIALQEFFGRIKKLESEHRPFILLGLAIGAVLLVVIWLALVML
jgi:hypothetical protein